MEPDVLLTMNMAALVFYHGDTPAVLSRDTTFMGSNSFGLFMEKLPLVINMWQEKMALKFQRIF